MYQELRHFLLIGELQSHCHYTQYTTSPVMFSLKYPLQIYRHHTEIIHVSRLSLLSPKRSVFEPRHRRRSAAVSPNGAQRGPTGRRRRRDAMEAIMRGVREIEMDLEAKPAIGFSIASVKRWMGGSKHPWNMAWLIVINTGLIVVNNG